jgi:transcriptional regulator with XRE-family HTH domain
MTDRVDFFIPGEAVSERPFRYSASGLDYVYLLNGVVREDDPDYGEIITIKEQCELHKAIGLHIIEKPGMTNREFKFLRKLMGCTQEELAWELQVDVQTIANYEKNGRIPGNSQKLMRWQFAMFLVPPDTKAKVIAELMKAEGDRKKGTSAFRRERGKIAPYWHERGQLAVASG